MYYIGGQDSSEFICDRWSLFLLLNQIEPIDNEALRFEGNRVMPELEMWRLTVAEQSLYL